MSKKNNHLISVILPCYNGEKHLQEAIVSCLNQTYEHFELIIVNDCSVDSSLEIASRFAQQDDRIFIINNKINKKLPASLNIGHQQAKGDFVTWTSDDNILKPNFLKQLLNAIKIHKADVVYSDYDIINSQGNIKRVHTTGPTENQFFGNKIGASFLYKKEVFQVLEGYDESLFLLEDYDFWLRAVTKFKFYHLDDNLYQYRIHENSLTSDIQKNRKTRNKHKVGVLKMFEKLSKEFHWSRNTFNLLTKSLLNEDILIIDYFKERLIIEKDLLKVNSKNLSKNTVLSGFNLFLRNQLITNNCDLKTLIWVLKHERWLLFHSSYSKKTTFLYISKSIFSL